MSQARIDTSKIIQETVTSWELA